MCLVGIAIITQPYTVCMWVRITRDKNEGIFLFLLEQERQKNRELALRYSAQESSETPAIEHQEYFPVPERQKITEKTSVSQSEQQRQTSINSHLEVLENKKHRIESFSTKTLYFKQLKLPKITFTIGTNLAIAVCSVISIITLLQLDAIINQSIYSNGLQFSPNFATSYLIAILTWLTMIVFVLIVATNYQLNSVTHKHSESKPIESKWSTYQLTDGTTIKVKTVLNRVQKINDHNQNKKSIYAIEADTIVEVTPLNSADQQPEKLTNNKRFLTQK